MHEIHQHDECRGHDDQPHHHGYVPLSGRDDGDLSEAGDGEHLLDDDCAAEQANELNGQHRERGSGGVAEDVFEHDAIEGQPAAAQGANVVLAKAIGN